MEPASRNVQRVGAGSTSDDTTTKSAVPTIAWASRSFTGFQALDRARQVDGALGEKDPGHRHDHVAQQGGRAVSDLARAEQHDARVGDEDPRELPNREPIAGDQEMGQHDGVDGVKVEEDRRVRRAGEPGPDVRRRHLYAEQQAQERQWAPLGGLDPEADEAAGGPGPETDHGAADDE